MPRAHGDHEQEKVDRENAKWERRQRHAYNELLVKIMSKMEPHELQRFGDRLLRRYLRPRT